MQVLTEREERVTVLIFFSPGSATVRAGGDPSNLRPGGRIRTVAFVEQVNGADRGATGETRSQAMTRPRCSRDPNPSHPTREAS
jgi:hypothetical protein